MQLYLAKKELKSYSHIHYACSYTIDTIVSMVIQPTAAMAYICVICHRARLLSAKGVVVN